ncbi:MAG: glycosyltransferase family 39 protein [Holosporaceae bacterium]|jgi:4-amino-4-deoxy-L-arabinose transferase-like glycosyltransferase|nr:glycosyltransferase family 39 protein [Holosporaceae bacterium]
MKFFVFSEKAVRLWVVAYFSVFSIIPMITRNIIPHDMIENLYWGKELQLGYAKHPPLFAWISYLFYRLCFSWPESLYILTQLNLALGFYFVFKVARLIFSDEKKAYGSVLIFMASACAELGNEKFNASTILMSLFPAMYYYFIRLLRYGRNVDAVRLGVFSAMAFVGKYFSLLYIGCVGLFLACHKKCWKFFKTPQIYIAVVVFTACVFWHVMWMYENDFITLKYAMGKSIHCPKDYFSAVNFLVMQCLLFSTAFWAFKYSCVGRMKFLPQGEYSTEERFIIFITIIPNVFLFVVSAITGMRIGSFWGTNMLMTVGVYLLILNPDFDYNRLQIFVKRISIFFAIALFLKLGVARYFLREYDPTNAINIRKVSEKIDGDWKKNFGDQRMKILKTDKVTAALHIHLKDSPSSYDIRRCELFEVHDLYPPNEDIAVAFLCRKDDGKIERFRKLYAGNILWENTIPVINDSSIYYAFVNVTGDSHD